MNSFQSHTDNINRIKQSPINSIYVATFSNDNTVKIWNITNPSNWPLIRNYTNHTQGVFGLEWISEDTIASGGYDNMIQIWSIKTGETKINIKTDSAVRTLKLLSNGFYLACGLGDGKITIHNVSNGSLISTLVGHMSYLNDLVQISDSLLASSSWENSIRIWDLTTNSTKFILTGHTSYVYGLKLISSDVLASGSLDKTIKFWDITNGQLIRNLTGHKNSIRWSIDILSDSQTLVSGSLDRTILIWNLTTGELVNSFNTCLKIRSLTVLKSLIAAKSKNPFFLLFVFFYLSIAIFLFYFFK
jgi:WD40 repeat protein